jgi:hypothetical protein
LSNFFHWRKEGHRLLGRIHSGPFPYDDDDDDDDDDVDDGN